MQEKTIETETKCDIDKVDSLFGTPQGILSQLLLKENKQTEEDLVFHKASGFKNSLEQYIYATKEKLDGILKGYYTDEERKNLTQFMDKLYEWLYSEDEKLYDMKTLEEKSKDMKTLGDEIYKRNELWTQLEKNFYTFESTASELDEQCKKEKEKLEKKQFVYVTAEDIVKIEDLIAKAIESAKKYREKCTPAPKIQRPPIDPNDISMLYKELRNNVKKIYDDAEFKVKEEERKRKEAEEKKKKEEEEKKEKRGGRKEKERRRRKKEKRRRRKEKRGRRKKRRKRYKKRPYKS
jgi:septal ring factor EnvC (AmiA/AmiB activator)